MTPNAIADFMASLFINWPSHIHLLDPGAGLGSLAEAFSEQFLKRAPRGSKLVVDCFEIEPALVRHLEAHLGNAAMQAQRAGFELSSTIHQRDFIEMASFCATMGGDRYTHAILNPPYKKIGSSSNHRKLLRTAGIETVNLYTAFLGLTIALMAKGGEVVAIVPRSFCNGTYFRPFREYLLSETALTHIHIFTSRSRTFEDDAVLQENIIVRLVRGGAQSEVTISESHDASLADYRQRTVHFDEIVNPGDRQRFIHVPTVELETSPDIFGFLLDELDIEVSTGPVVDFRVRESWLSDPLPDCAPLLYTHHLRAGHLEWPRKHKKPNALMLNEGTKRWLMPAGPYCLTKRFSAKEERRRVVAFFVDTRVLPYALVGFENHLNVFHCKKIGLPTNLAKGLSVFLNSSVVEERFRAFSGHTQVNATDLRVMRYPSRSALLALGANFEDLKTQVDIDAAVRSLAKP